MIQMVIRHQWQLKRFKNVGWGLDEGWGELKGILQNWHWACTLWVKNEFISSVHRCVLNNYCVIHTIVDILGEYRSKRNMSLEPILLNMVKVSLLPKSDSHIVCLLSCLGHSRVLKPAPKGHLNYFLASIPNSMLRDIMLEARNWPWWKYILITEIGKYYKSGMLLLPIPASQLLNFYQHTGTGSI